MYVSESYFIIFDIIVVLIMAISLIIGFKKGFLYQLLDLLSLVLALLIAWFLAPILAEHLPFLSGEATLTEAIVHPLVNMLIWMVIVTLVVKIVFAFILPLFKSVKKIPIIGGLNAVGGLITGFINGYIWISILCFLLMTPLFQNGADVKENTIIKPFNGFCDYVISSALEKVDPALIEDGMNGINEYRDTFEAWLEDQGVFNE